MKSLVLLAFVSSSALAGEMRDCSEAYNGKQTSCEVVECSDKFKSFLGTWTGPFQIYSQQYSKMISYLNTVTYSEKDCLKNTENGELFIIGRKTDVYAPVVNEAGEVVQASVTKPGLMITGKDAKGERFLRTIDSENGLVNYSHVFTDVAAELSIWQFTYPGDGQNAPMTIRVIDGRDLSEVMGAHKRFVTITMQGSFGEVVGGSGYHTLRK